MNKRTIGSLMITVGLVGILVVVTGKGYQLLGILIGFLIFWLGLYFSLNYVVTAKRKDKA